MGDAACRFQPILSPSSVSSLQCSPSHSGTVSSSSGPCATGTLPWRASCSRLAHLCARGRECVLLAFSCLEKKATRSLSLFLALGPPAFLFSCQFSPAITRGAVPCEAAVAWLALWFAGGTLTAGCSASWLEQRAPASRERELVASLPAEGMHAPSSGTLQAEIYLRVVKTPLPSEALLVESRAR